MRTIDWRHGRVVIVDQTRRPHDLVLVDVDRVDELIDAVTRLAVWLDEPVLALPAHEPQAHTC